VNRRRNKFNRACPVEPAAFTSFKTRIGQDVVIAENTCEQYYSQNKQRAANTFTGHTILLRLDIIGKNLFKVVLLKLKTNKYSVNLQSITRDASGSFILLFVMSGFILYAMPGY